MWWLFAYKAMLFLGFLICCLIAWRLYIKDGAKPVVDEMSIWKIVTIKGAHSGTVFVALAAACFIVLVTTKSSYEGGGEKVTLMSENLDNEKKNEITPETIDPDIGQTLTMSPAPGFGATTPIGTRDHRRLVMKNGPWDDDSAEETTP